MKPLFPALALVALPTLLLAVRTSGAQISLPSPQGIRVTPAQEPRYAPADHFTGSVKLSGGFQADAPARAGGATVIFYAGSRTHWHTHPLGQTLVITEGQGRVQQWGEPIRDVKKGDIVWIPPGVKHWHGAGQKFDMAHVAIAESQNGKSVDWLEEVSDDQYRGTVMPEEESKAPNQEPTVAQKNFGEFSPKFAQLTDDVLFGDVWERPDLSKRDRSLVVVSALIANGNTEQLAGHLQRAKDNGVTEAELKEAIIQLAFYTGWPRAVSAINVAKEVFKKP